MSQMSPEAVSLVDSSGHTALMVACMHVSTSVAKAVL
jgi:hypothetical protein